MMQHARLDKKEYIIQIPQHKKSPLSVGNKSTDTTETKP